LAREGLLFELPFEHGAGGHGSKVGGCHCVDLHNLSNDCEKKVVWIF